MIEYKYEFICKRCQCSFGTNFPNGPKACPVCKSYKWREPQKSFIALYKRKK